MRCPNCNYDIYRPGRTCIRCGYALHNQPHTAKTYRDFCKWVDADLRYTSLMMQVIQALIVRLLSSTAGKSNAAIRTRFNAVNSIWLRLCARYRMTKAKDDFKTYVKLNYPKLNEALRGE